VDKTVVQKNQSSKMNLVSIAFTQRYRVSLQTLPEIGFAGLALRRSSTFACATCETKISAWVQTNAPKGNSCSHGRSICSILGHCALGNLCPCCDMKALAIALLTAALRSSLDLFLDLGCKCRATQCDNSPVAPDKLVAYLAGSST
jgi:hypothetical protein